MANKPQDFPIYKEIPSDEMTRLVDSYLHGFEIIVNNIFSKQVSSNISCDRVVLTNIIDRVQRRRIYFHIFYNGTQMGDINEASLICFLILKLTPFSHVDIPNANLNVKIAYHFLVDMLSFISGNKKVIDLNAVQKYNLLYAFKYRDLSKEAIMAIAESLIS